MSKKTLGKKCIIGIHPNAKILPICLVLTNFSQIIEDYNLFKTSPKCPMHSSEASPPSQELIQSKQPIFSSDRWGPGTSGKQNSKRIFHEPYFYFLCSPTRRWKEDTTLQSLLFFNTSFQGREG